MTISLAVQLRLVISDVCKREITLRYAKISQLTSVDQTTQMKRSSGEEE